MEPPSYDLYRLLCEQPIPKAADRYRDRTWSPLREPVHTPFLLTPVRQSIVQLQLVTLYILAMNRVSAAYAKTTCSAVKISSIRVRRMKILEQDFRSRKLADSAKISVRHRFHAAHSRSRFALNYHVSINSVPFLYFFCFFFVCLA